MQISHEHIQRSALVCFEIRADLLQMTWRGDFAKISPVLGLLKIGYATTFDIYKNREKSTFPNNPKFFKGTV